MTSFDVSEIPEETLIKIVDASFPGLEYSLIDGQIVFSGLSTDSAEKFEELVKTCKFAARFSSPSTVFRPQVSFDVRDYINAPSVDVNLILKDRGDLVWAGEGLATISGDLLRLKRKLEYYWSRVASEISAIEIENSGLWGVEVVNQSQYMDDFPHEAALVIGCKKNDSSVANVSALLSEGLSENASSLANVNSDLRILGVCQPSVCTSCYHALGVNGAGGDATYTTFNRVFRNEGTCSLDRLLSFSVRDLMAVGRESFVRGWREEFISLAQIFITRLGIPVEIEVATDPFFASAADKLIVQQSAQLKHELLINIPQTERRIAIGSVNLHLNVFGSRFSVMADNEAVFSCCMGIGFERVSYALMSYYGVDFEKWPEETKRVLDLADRT